MGKYSIIETIKKEKKDIEKRLSAIPAHKELTMTVEVMTQTWIIKSNIDWIKKWAEADYTDKVLTLNQYKLVRSYITEYENQVWSRLYDMAQNHDLYE